MTAVGNLLVVGVMTGGTFDSSVVEAPAGWSWPVQNQRTQEDDAGNWCNVFYKTSEGDDAITFRLASPGGSHRVALVEYAGLSNPTLAGGPTYNLEDPGDGNANMPGMSYPAGPAAVVWVCFMEDGPSDGGPLFVEDGTATLRTPISADLHGSGETAIADLLFDTTAGTTAGQQLGGTNLGSTLSVGLVFEGAGCGEIVESPLIRFVE